MAISIPVWPFLLPLVLTLQLESGAKLGVLATLRDGPGNLLP